MFRIVQNLAAQDGEEMTFVQRTEGGWHWYDVSDCDTTQCHTALSYQEIKLFMFQHWNSEETLEAIRSQVYDVVIMQEFSRGMKSCTRSTVVGRTILVIVGFFDGEDYNAHVNILCIFTDDVKIVDQDLIPECLYTRTGLAQTDEVICDTSYPYAYNLVNEVRTYSPDAMIQFYQTWGYESASPG